MKMIAMALSVACAAPAMADVVYQSATYTGVDNGDYSIYDGRWFGAGFTLSQTTTITAIGGQFQYTDGDLFGAIVALPAVDQVPSFQPADIEANAIASTVFTIGDGGLHDYSTPLSVTLAPGSYAVIFGSGAFGATGSSGMGADNDVVGTPQLFERFDVVSGGAWDQDASAGLRLFVEGSSPAVPELASWMLMIAGFGTVGAVARRRTACALA